MSGCLGCGAKPEIELLPCGHRCFCNHCVHRIPTPPPWACPLCKRVVTTLQELKNPLELPAVPKDFTLPAFPSSSSHDDRNSSAEFQAEEDYDDAPLCDHGDEAVRLTCNNGGPNHGREFWRCPHWRNEHRRCRFLRWIKKNSNPFPSTTSALSIATKPSER